MKVLVTGAFGYLGGRLARELSVRPEVRLLLGSREVRVTPPWLPRAQAVQTHWRSVEELARICRGVDVVVHLAATNAKACAANPVSSLESARHSVANLVSAASRSRVQRFVYVSTAHVYGAQAGTIDEASVPAPKHPYATMHLEGEQLVQGSSEGEFSQIVVRLSNGFGAPVLPDVDCWSLLVNDLCRQAVHRGKIVLTSKTLQRRDFISMTDAVRGLVHLMCLPGLHLGERLFNLGGGWTPTNLDVARLVAEAMSARFGKEIPVVSGALAGQSSPPQLNYQTTRLRGTGFEPSGRVDIELRELLTFCRAHFAARAG